MCDTQLKAVPHGICSRMKLEEVAALYEGSSSYETQYLPTFKKVLTFLNSEDVRDICVKYDEYKDKIPGITSDAKTKHIKSLRDKLTKKGVMHPACLTPRASNGDPLTLTVDEGESSDEEDSQGEDVEDFVRKIKHLSWKAQVLEDFYDSVIDHIQFLPPEVLAKLVKQNVVSRIQAIYDLSN